MFWYYFFPPLMELAAAMIIYGGYLRRCSPRYRHITCAVLGVIYLWAAGNFLLRDYLGNKLLLWGSGVCVALLLMWAVGALLYQGGRQLTKWKRFTRTKLYQKVAAYPAIITVIKRSYFFFFALIYPLVALWFGHQLPQVVAIDLPLSPKAAATITSTSSATLKVVFLSDLHLGTLQGSAAYLAKVVAIVQHLHPDLVLIGGDLVDHQQTSFLPLIRDLKKLNPPWGMYFAIGNHECLAPDPHILAELKTIGVTPLVNQSVTLHGKLNVAGVGDEDCGHWGAAYLPRMPVLQNPQLPTILLAHRPNLMRDPFLADVDLALLGHTHGGQIEPFALLPRLTNLYFKGLYPKMRPSAAKRLVSYYYVNQGTGTSGPPMRFLTFSEITVFNLHF